MARGLCASFCRGITRDHYVRSLSPEMRGYLFGLYFLRAAGDLEGMPAEVVASAIGCRPDEYEDVTRHLASRGLLDSGAERLELREFKKRYYRPGASAERMRRKRERDRRARFELSRVTQKSGVTCDAEVTPRDAASQVVSRGAAIDPGRQISRAGAKGCRPAQDAAPKPGGPPPVSPRVECDAENGASQGRDAHVYVDVVSHGSKNDEYVYGAEEGVTLKSPKKAKDLVAFLPGVPARPGQMCMPAADARSSPAPIVDAGLSGLVELVPPEHRNPNDLTLLEVWYKRKGYHYVHAQLRYAEVMCDPATRKPDKLPKNYWGYLVDCLKHNHARNFQRAVEIAAEAARREESRAADPSSRIFNEIDLGRAQAQADPADNEFWEEQRKLNPGLFSGRKGKA